MQDEQAVEVAAEGTEFAELVDAGDEESGVDRACHVRGDGDLGGPGRCRREGEPVGDVDRCAGVLGACQAEQRRGRVALRCDELGLAYRAAHRAMPAATVLAPLPPRAPATVIVRVMCVSISLSVQG